MYNNWNCVSRRNTHRFIETKDGRFAHQLSSWQRSDILKCTLEHVTPQYKTFWGPFFISDWFYKVLRIPLCTLETILFPTPITLDFKRIIIRVQDFPHFGTLSNALHSTGPALFALLTSLSSHIKCHPLLPKSVHYVANFILKLSLHYTSQNLCLNVCILLVLLIWRAVTNTVTMSGEQWTNSQPPMC